jgi:hypothetical protein
MISRYQSEASDKVSEYLRGPASLVDLENWIWTFLGDLEDSHDEEARNLAGTIGSLISEYSYGDRTEGSMREEMATAIRPFRSSIRYFRYDGSSVQRKSPPVGYKYTDVRAHLVA